MLKLLGRLYREEEGLENVEWVLIIAAVALPILGLLLYYRQNLGQWVADQWNTVTGSANQPIPQGQGQ